MITMSAVAGTPEDKPARSTRSPRRTGEPSSRVAPVATAKSRDASKTKVSFYLDNEVAEKLAFKAIRRRVDQSDLANEILGKDVSSMVCFDRAERQTKATCDNGEDRSSDAAA